MNLTDFKAVYLNTFLEKETNLLGSHIERRKEAMMTVSHQIETINRNINYFLKEPNENSGVASIINETEDLLVGLTQHLF